MRQGTSPVHLGKVNDLPQRFVVGGGVAAAAGAKGNRECSLVGNIFFADLKDSRQVFEGVKPHVQGSAPVILRHPVPKFTAAESKSVKIILPDHITINPGQCAGRGKAAAEQTAVFRWLRAVWQAPVPISGLPHGWQNSFSGSHSLL